MRPLSFPGVCDFVKNGSDPKLIASADLLLGVILVLGPTAAHLSPEAVAAGLSLLGAKNELVKIGKAIYKKLTKPVDDDEVARQERMSVAFCLITYTAFFEALAKLLPEINKIISLTDAGKLRLAHSTPQSTIADPCTEPTAGLPDFTTEVPHPAETLEQVIGRTLPLYQELTKGVMRLLEAYSAWESLTEKKRSEAHETFQNLPKAAAERFRVQYFELAARFPDFSVWTNLREHSATQAQIENLSKSARLFFRESTIASKDIDIGLKRLWDEVQSIPQQLEDYRAQSVWRDIEKQYNDAIKQPLIKDLAHMEAGNSILKYPARSDIFVPQSFKSLRYTNGMHLEDETTWEKLAVRNDIGTFLLGYLNSPYSTASPLIILGHPGSGKSLLSQMIAARTMSNAFAPIRLELRSINADNEIEIEEQIGRDIARPIAFASLMDSLNKRPAVVIFDGYDELLQATGQVFAGYLAKVQRFQERESRTLDRNPVRSIVTSRITLIDKAVIPEGSTVLRLLEFDEGQKKKWISVWNSANKSYFGATGVKAFSLPVAPKLAPIAEQPLLLLMLALYDSKANDLHKATGLDQTVLYDSLLRRFIERERIKDPEFENIKEAAARDSEISRDMERLGVAAIGMFNRHALHIRATQLNGDIEFFELGRQVPSGTGRPLSQAELVLGSFFFVHQSTAQQRGDAGEDKEADAAFEFLHNTFGEFLTGHFLVTQLLKQTQTLFKLRADPDLIAQRSKVLNDSNGFPAAWYVGLMHAALFSRPVIFTMLSEWFTHAIARGGRAREEVLADFDDILYYEIRRATTGREFPQVMAGRATSFDSLPLLGYLANYTLNLLTLRVALSGTDFVFDEGWFGTVDGCPRIWDRLAHLWKSWFSTDALSALSAVFTAERDGTKMVVKRSQLVSSPSIGKRIETVMNVALALGDDATIAIGGTLMNDPFRRQSIALSRAERAAHSEGLGLDDEILHREILNAARLRVTDAVREDLFVRCTKMVELVREANIGKTIELVRSYELLDDHVRYETLVGLLIGAINPHTLFQPFTAFNKQALSAICDLVSRFGPGVWYPFVDPLVDQLVHNRALLRDAPANLVFALGQTVSMRGVVPDEFIELLAERADDQDYISALSPEIALGFLHAADQPKRRNHDPAVSRLLDVFLRPNKLLEMRSGLAVGILNFASKPRFRQQLRRFCEDLPLALSDQLRGRRYRVHRFQTYLDSLLPERVETAQKFLEVVALAGSEHAKKELNKVAVDIWFGRSRYSLSLAVLHYVRRVDDGALLFSVVGRNGQQMFGRGPVGGPRANVITRIMRSDFRNMSIQELLDVDWLSSKIGDQETREKIAGLIGPLRGGRPNAAGAPG